ncbi:MAG: hypothetical protein HY703_08040 [Gemmatimonadetes bacterium]|nr:hypothetical protein [Gemmatimonadota bacterium]
MVPVTSLWLPILLSAVIVFLASWVIHMFLRYHQTDFSKLAAEDEVMAALGKFGIAPGNYMMPYGGGPEARKSPEFMEKVKRGPVAMLTVWPSGPPAMGKNLAQWFVYCVLVGIFAAYIAGRALGPGSAGVEYPDVFRFAGTTAFVGYAVALWQDAIWFRRGWGTTIKNTIDGLVYALLTAGVFGWLWPA